MLNRKYETWAKQWGNPESVGPWSYINENIHPEEILIIGELLFPNTVEIDGCLFLSEKYNHDSYLQWCSTLSDDKTAIEKVINHIHVYDLFDSLQEEIDNEVFVQMARLIQQSWEMYFKRKYSDRIVKVDFSNEEEDYGPTIVMYQQR